MEHNITSKIRGLLAAAGKRNIDLAEYYGVLPQSIQNKFTRGSFSADDLIKIADFTGAELAYTLGDSKIVLGKDCIRSREAEPGK